MADEEVKKRVDEFRNVRKDTAIIKTLNIETEVFDRLWNYINTVFKENPRTFNPIVRLAVDEFLKEIAEDEELEKEVRQYPLQRKLKKRHKVCFLFSKEQGQIVEKAKNEYRTNLSLLIEVAIVRFLDKEEKK